jgi:hypothetical protein
MLHDEVLKKTLLKFENARIKLITDIINKGKMNVYFLNKMLTDDLMNLILGSFQVIVFKWYNNKHLATIKPKLVYTMKTIINSYLVNTFSLNKI